MRLAIISNVGGYSWAGSEELWYEIARLQLRSGGAVTAILHKDIVAGRQCAQLANEGAKISAWRSPIVRRFQPVLQKIAPSFTNQRLGRPDVVLVSCGSLPALTYVPGLVDYLVSCPVPFVVLCQFNADTLSFTSRERDILRAVVQRAARFIFVSSENLALARRQLAIAFENALVIPNSIRLNLEKPLPFPPLDPVAKLASVARLDTHWKGQEVLLRLLAQPRWNERPWELSLFGEGSDQDYLKACVDFYGLHQKVLFRGYVRDVREIWTANHLMLAPSRGEGMSLAMLEAMMCGRPIVITDVGGVSECIADGITGFVAGAPTLAMFDEGLERAWANRRRWSAMGEASHIRAKEIAEEQPALNVLQLLRGVASA